MKKVEKLREEVIGLLNRFETVVDTDLRDQVRALIPIWNKLNEIGSALLPHEVRSAARDRLLYYFRRYPMTVLSQNELAIVAGISEWARRVRELRVEFGWSIVSGTAAREMIKEGDLDSSVLDSEDNIHADDYIMVSTEQDREAAFRWKVAKEIRNKKLSVRNKILEYLRMNIGKPVSGEELRYVAKNKTEWARRVRELRTEEGWPISSYWNGRPELRSGLYLLEQDRQTPPHDRRIPDPMRRAALVRDGYECQKCRWTRKQWTRDDPRHLELHHIEHHAKGGANETENLITLCNVCHDLEHAK
ncbi:MAG: HNH endonuclease signature motif containing protein [Opitutaceae bacterium]